MNTELLFSDLGGDEDVFGHRNASAVSLQQNTKTNSESIFCDEKVKIFPTQLRPSWKEVKQWAYMKSTAHTHILISFKAIVGEKDALNH